MTIGGHRVSTEIVNAVQRAANSTGVDFNYLMSQAAQESGFRTNARAGTSSATGLFQFIDSTWLQMVRDHGAKYGLGEYARAIEGAPGTAARVPDRALRQQILDLRYNAEVSSAMAAEYANNNKQQLERSLGRSVGAAELYMAHFLGAAGATRFLSALSATPNVAAADLLPDAASANTNVFYDNNSGRALSVRQVYDRMARRIESRAAEVRNATNGGGSDQRVFQLFAARNGTGSPLRYVSTSAPIVQQNAGNVGGNFFANLRHLSPALAPETTIALANLDTGLPSRVGTSRTRVRGI